jgi:bifunctional DNase/RNase
MEDKLIEVHLKKIVPSPTGCALFLGNNKKTFVIYIGPNEGAFILMMTEGVKNIRPLTYDLIQNIFLGLGVTVEKVVINNLVDNTFYARLFLSEKNELGQKIVEIDARPSDCVAIALQHKSKVYIVERIFNMLEDVTDFLNKDESPS